MPLWGLMVLVSTLLLLRVIRQPQEVLCRKGIILIIFLILCYFGIFFPFFFEMGEGETSSDLPAAASQIAETVATNHGAQPIF